MKMQRNTGWTRLMVLGLALGLASLLAGCGSDATTGSPASLSFTATDGGTVLGMSTPMVAVAGGDVTAFNLGVSKIELEQDMDVEVDSEVEFTGSFIVDLLTGTITDTAGGGPTTVLTDVLPSGIYEELEFELTPLAGVGSGGAISAMYVAGSYTSGGTVNYTIDVQVPIKVEVEGPQGIVLDGATNDLIVAFRLDALLTATNLDSLGALGTSAAGGWSLVIDGTTPPDTVLALGNIIHDALEFGEDHDGDHDLDEDEDVDDDSSI